jgi:hypothetical protein
MMMWGLLALYLVGMLVWHIACVFGSPKSYSKAGVIGRTVTLALWPVLAVGVFVIVLAFAVSEWATGRRSA